MKTASVLGLTRPIAPFAAVLVVLTGCASSNKLPPAAQGASTTSAAPASFAWAESMPPGRTHGMPYTSAAPEPAWYAQRFSPARGVGETLRRNHIAQWDKDALAYTYYIGGLLYAHYQPYEQVLSIRTDHGGDAETTCAWDVKGVLTVTPSGGEEVCGQLFDELDRHLARTGHFPPISAALPPR